MTLEWQDVDIDMVGSLDTKSNPNNVVQTNLDTADNVVFTKFGAATPRQGVNLLSLLQRDQIIYKSPQGSVGPTNATICGASPALNPYLVNLNTLYKHKEQVLGCDGYRMMTLDRVSLRWQTVGPHTPSVVRRTNTHTYYQPTNKNPATGIYNTGGGGGATAMAVTGNYVIYAYTIPASQGGISGLNVTTYLTVYDRLAGTAVIDNAIIAQGIYASTPRIAVTSSGVAVFCVSGGLNVTGAFWQSATPTTYTPFYQAAFFTYFPYDYAYNPNSDRAAILTSNGAGDVIVYYYTISGAGLTIVNTTTVAAAVNINAGAISANEGGNELYDIVYSTTATLGTLTFYTARVNQAVTIAPVAQTVPAITGLTSLLFPFIKREFQSGSVIVGWTALRAPSTIPEIFYFCLNNNTLVRDATKTTFNYGFRYSASGKPVVYDRQVYLPVTIHSGSTLKKFGLLMLSSVVDGPDFAYVSKEEGQVISNGLPEISTTTGELFLPFSVTRPGANELTFGAGTSPGSFQVVYGYMTLSFSEPGKIGNYVEHNQGTIFASGYPKFYDGASFTEFGFPLAPIINSTITYSAAVGGYPDGVTNGSTYAWCAVYAWTDANGRMHRSQPSNVVIDTATLNGAASLRVERPSITLKRATDADMAGDRNIQIELYRTLAGQSGPFYLSQVVGGGIPAGTVPGTSYVTIRDDVPDATLEANRQLYTTGDVLPNETPPAMTDICVYADRVFFIDGEKNAVSYLKSGTTDEYAGYSSYLKINVGDQFEPLTAIQALDRTLFAFKDTKLFQSAGLPANDQGVGGSIDSFLPIASEVGCPYPKSVLPTPNGLIFCSLKGFYLADRGGNTQYIGAPVEGYMLNMACSGSELVYNSGAYQARFMGVTSDRSVSYIFCYDTQLNKWSRFTYNQTTVGGDLVWADGFLWISGYTPGVGSSFMREDPPGTNTSNEIVTCAIQTGWISPFGRMHQGKIKRVSALFYYEANGTVNVNMTIDTNYGNPGLTGNTTTSNFQFVTGTGIYTPGIGANARVRLRTASQRAESFRVKVQWNKTSGYAGLWASLSSLSAEVAGMAGQARLPATQTPTNT